MMKISEMCEIYPFGSDDIDTADVTGAYKDVSNARKLYGAIQTVTNITAAKVVTLKLMQAQSAAGLNAKQLGATVTLVGAGAPLGGEIDADVADMDINNGFTHVAVQVGTDEGAAVVAGMVLILSDRRYMP